MALPKFSELLFRINNPGVTTNEGKETEQVNEISGALRGRAAGMRVDREFGQKPPSKSDLRKGNTMANKHERTQKALAADPDAPGFAKGYMTKKEEYSIFESATYSYNDNDAPEKLTSGYETDDIDYPSVKAHMKNKGVPEDHANAIVAHLKKGSGYTDSKKPGFDVQSEHGGLDVHSRSNSETGKTKFHVSDAKK